MSTKTKLNLECGKYYRRRDGKIVGPTYFIATEKWYYIGDDPYNEHGESMYDNESFDLIQEVEVEVVVREKKQVRYLSEHLDKGLPPEYAERAKEYVKENLKSHDLKETLNIMLYTREWFKESIEGEDFWEQVYGWILGRCKLPQMPAITRVGRPGEVWKLVNDFVLLGSKYSTVLTGIWKYMGDGSPARFFKTNDYIEFVAGSLEEFYKMVDRGEIKL